MAAGTTLVPAERIERRICLVRGQKVMLSPDLADLYGVPVRQLNQAVKRNIQRFPSDFMFQLSPAEYAVLKSQIVISSWGGVRRARPYAFTEQGIAMLSAVLRSPIAVAVSIEIMRVFVRLRQMLESHERLRKQLEELERRLQHHDEQFAVVFDAIRQVMNADEEEMNHPRIGYQSEERG
jgi:hypothetical protein